MDAQTRLQLAGATSPDAVALAKFVSLAVRLEPLLLRRARLKFLPKSRASTEAALWFGPLVETRGSRFIFLYADVADELRRRLLQTPAQLDEAWRLLQGAHAHHPLLVRTEEQIVYASLRPDRAGGVGAAGDLLLSAAKSIVRDGRRGLAQWALGVLPRLPADARAGVAGEILRDVADLVIAPGRAVSRGGSRVPPHAAAKLAGGPAERGGTAGDVPVGVRLVGDTLHIDEGGDLPPGTQFVKVPALSPRTVHVRWGERPYDGTTLVWRPGGHATLDLSGHQPITVRSLGGDLFTVERKARAVGPAAALLAGCTVHIGDATGWLIDEQTIVTPAGALATRRTPDGAAPPPPDRATFALLPGRPEVRVSLVPDEAVKGRSAPLPRWAEFNRVARFHVHDLLPRGAEPAQAPAADPPAPGRPLYAFGRPPWAPEGAWHRFTVPDVPADAPSEGEGEACAPPLSPFVRTQSASAHYWTGSPLADPVSGAVYGIVGAPPPTGYPVLLGLTWIRQQVRADSPASATQFFHRRGPEDVRLWIARAARRFYPLLRLIVPRETEARAAALAGIADLITHAGISREFPARLHPLLDAVAAALPQEERRGVEPVRAVAAGLVGDDPVASAEAAFAALRDAVAWLERGHQLPKGATRAFLAALLADQERPEVFWGDGREGDVAEELGVGVHLWLDGRPQGWPDEPPVLPTDIALRRSRWVLVALAARIARRFQPLSWRYQPNTPAGPAGRLDAAIDAVEQAARDGEADPDFARRLAEIAETMRSAADVGVPEVTAEITRGIANAADLARREGTRDPSANAGGADTPHGLLVRCADAARLAGESLGRPDERRADPAGTPAHPYAFRDAFVRAVRSDLEAVDSMVVGERRDPPCPVEQLPPLWPADDRGAAGGAELEAILGRLPEPDPPRRWVLVVGLGKATLPEPVLGSAKAVGLALARGGWGLITGGWPGVDYVAAASFDEATRRMGGGAARLVHVIPSNKKPEYRHGRVVAARGDDEAVRKSVRLADAVVLISGAGDTAKIARLATREGRAVLPLSRTGGDAERVYQDLEKDVRRAAAEGRFGALMEPEWESLSAPAPGVAGVMASVLERLFSRMDEVGVPPAMPVDPDDPQKARWGGAAERNGFALRAVVEPEGSTADLCRVTLSVEQAGAAGEDAGAGPLAQGEVAFHLHDSFEPWVRRVPFMNGRAELVLYAYAPFTVGAEVSGATPTLLELDMTQLPNLPGDFLR